MAKTYTQAELEAYLDEALPAEQMARIEQALQSGRFVEISRHKLTVHD